jgi:O-antigen/teichoic acid export membrane protein
MKKDLLITFATQGLVLICGLLAYRLAKQNFGEEGFAIYALARRTHSLIFPILLIGSSVAIPRFIAFSKVHDEKKADGYFKAAITLIGILTSFFVIIVNMLPTFSARVLFGDSKLANMMMPISVMMIGYVLHSMSYDYFRGHSRMFICNLFQAVNTALIPILAINISKTAAQALTWTGVGWIIGGGSVLLLLILPRMAGKLSSVIIKEFFLFGIQRIPSDFGAAALLGLPATLTAHAAGVIAGGHVAFSISLLNMCGAVFAPIGVVLLPRASAALARKEHAVVRRLLKTVIITSLTLSLAMVICFETNTIPVIQLYLGHAVETELVSKVKIIMLAAVPYTLYIASRSMIDAFFTKSVNAMNILLSLAVFLMLTSTSFIQSFNFMTPLNAFVLALFFLGFATLITSARMAKNLALEKNQ